MNLKVVRTIALGAAGSIGLCAYAGSEQPLTPTELEQARRSLDRTRNGIIAATSGLSEVQWKFKPAPDRWSIAEIIEHIVLAQELVLGPVWEQLAKAPPSAGERDYKQVDAIVINQFPDRSHKFTAPEVLQPTGRWTPTVSLDRLLKNYAQLTSYLESPPDLRHHLLPAPPLKAISNGAFESMDGYHWVLATSAHVERHTKQIEEVKADAHFPVH